jgi:hypothetical protein
MELPSETLAHRLNQRIAVAVFVADLSLWRFAEESLLRRGFNPAARSGIRRPGARREYAREVLRRSQEISASFCNSRVSARNAATR